MASPQTENGYLRIASEIVKQLSRLNLSAYEWRVLWVVWLKTWGWHKKLDTVPLTQIAKMTGIQRSHVAEAKTRLLKKNILFARGSKIGFEKDYERWRIEAKGGPDSGTPLTADKVVPIQGTGSPDSGTPPVVPIQGPSKDTKNTSQKTDDKNNRLHQVFDHWNSYKGKPLCKRDKDGKESTVAWRTHKLKDDGSMAPDVRQAISEALKAGYSVKEICGAIDNYAKILLSADYWWSHVWPLSTFLMVKYERRKDAEYKWWQFLPDNFDEGKYLTDAAKRKRTDQGKGPTPLQVVKEQIERQRNKTDERKQTA